MKEHTEEKIQIDSNSMIILLVDNDSVTTSGLTLNIQNETDNTIDYGAWYRLEKLQDKDWRSVEPLQGVSWAQDDWKKPVEPGAQATVDYCWDWYYGMLPAGKYRIIVSILAHEGSYGDTLISYNLAAEFSVHN